MGSGLHATLLMIQKLLLGFIQRVACFIFLFMLLMLENVKMTLSTINPYAAGSLGDCTINHMCFDGI